MSIQKKIRQAELKIELRKKLAEAEKARFEAERSGDEKKVQAMYRRHEALLAEHDELLLEWDQLELDELRGQANQGNSRRPYGGDVSQRGIDDGIDDEGHRTAFAAWLRDPQSTTTRNQLAEVEKRVHSGTTNSSGGFLVPTSIAAALLSRARDENPFSNLVTRYEVGQSRFSIPIANADATVSWAAELDTRSATTEASFTAKTPNMGTCYALISFSEELLEDSVFNLAKWYAEEAGRMIGEAEMSAILTGAGGAAPVGLLNTAPEPDADGSRTADALRYIPSGNASTLGSAPADLLISTLYDLHASYRRNAVWAMNSATAAALRQLKDGSGRYLWAEGLAEGQPNLLLGYPVVIAEAMAGVGTNAFPIAFGDFGRGYAMTELAGNRGVTTLADPYTTPGRVRVYLRRRIGGCPLDENAIRVIKCAVS